jgi:hypothetical protein
MMALCEEHGLKGAMSLSKTTEETRGTRIFTLASLSLDTIPNDPSAPARLERAQSSAYRCLLQRT